MVKQAILNPKKNLLKSFNDIDWHAVAPTTISSMNSTTITLNITTQYGNYILNTDKATPCKGNTTYTVSASQVDGLGAFIGINFFNSSFSNIGNANLNSNAKINTFTTPSNCFYIQVVLASRDVSGGGICTFSNIQLEEGSTATPFEPYSLVNKSANLVPKKNLVDLKNLTFVPLSTTETYTLDNSGVTVTIPNTKYGITSNQTISVKPNTTYSVSFIMNVLSGVGIATTGMRVYLVDTATYVTVSGVNFTFNSGANTSIKILFYGGSPATGNITVNFSNIQLEEGSTATAFEPYIPLNKPAFVSPKKNILPTDVVAWEIGNLNGTGQPSASTSAIRLKDFWPILPNTTYKPSYDVNEVDINVIHFYDFNKNFISFSSLTGNSFTTPSNAYYFKLRYQNDFISAMVPEDITKAKYQIEQGSTATPFEPYSLVNKSANLIYPTVTITSDFTGKVAGSVVENPNIHGRNASGTLLPPSNFVEKDQTIYNSIMALDGNVHSFPTTLNGSIAQQLFSFDILQIIERYYGNFWKYKTLAEKVAIAKSMITNVTCDWYGYGSGIDGNKATLNRWVTSSYGIGVNHTNGSVTKLSYSWGGSNSELQSDGFAHFLAYANASDGVTPSVVNTDYVTLSLVTTSPFAINKPAL